MCILGSSTSSSALGLAMLARCGKTQLNSLSSCNLDGERHFLLWGELPMLTLYDLMEDKVVQKYITFSNLISCEQLSLMIPIPKTTWFWVFDHLCFHPLRTMWQLNLVLIILKIKKVEMYGSLILLVIL